MDDQIKSYVRAAGAEDLGRIVRSDMTRMTEMMHRYRSLAQGAPDEVAEQIFDVLHTAATTRQALLQVSAVASGYEAPPAMGPGVDAGEAPKPDVFTIQAPGGKPMLLSSVLGNAGFVSSSGVAKRGIKAGQVVVNGEVSSVDKTLELDTVYELTCGEVTAKIKITG